MDSFREFGKLVRRTARDVKKVEFIKDPSMGGRPAVREVVFLDTAGFGLYNNAFILRRRIAYADGFPVGDPEIVFKFRHPDLQKAAELDVRPNVPGSTGSSSRRNSCRCASDSGASASCTPTIVSSV